MGGGCSVPGLEGTEGRGRRGSTHKLSDFADFGARTDRVLFLAISRSSQDFAVKPHIWPLDETGKDIGLGFMSVSKKA